MCCSTKSLKKKKILAGVVKESERSFIGTRGSVEGSNNVNWLSFTVWPLPHTVREVTLHLALAAVLSVYVSRSTWK